jgi:hypothetical protein
MFDSTKYTRLIMRAAPLLNVPVAAMASSPLMGGMLSRNIALICYTGRRSGREFTVPVAYKRRGDAFEVAANLPDAKTWWRNFLGEGAPMTLGIDGTQRAGHAVAHRDEKGRVAVAVRLDDSPGQ